MSTKLVILDRDGVINEDSDAFVKTAAEWRPIPGSLEAIARLNQAGYRVVVCTNQSGIARGLLRSEDLHAMHLKMDRLLAQVGGQIDAVFYCPDAPDSDSQCRKPAPGMLHDVAARLHVDLRDVPSGRRQRERSARGRQRRRQPVPGAYRQGSLDGAETQRTRSGVRQSRRLCRLSARPWLRRRASYFKPLLRVRGFLFWVPVALIVGVFGPVVCASYVVPLEWRYRIVRLWTFLTLLSLRGFCGLGYRIHWHGELPRAAK